MISSNMAEKLNKHMNAEFYSSYLYLSMSAYASSKGWRGASNWLFVQAQEEMVHVQKLYGYIDDQDARIELYTIEQPPAEFGSPLELFGAVLSHEQKVTGLVGGLVTIAVEEADHATETFLQWFVTEQTEEEKSCRDILDRLKLAGETGPGLFMIDNELAVRVLAPPTP
jgi:ferritin